MKNDSELLNYVLKITGVNKKGLIFVIIDGSAGSGKDQKYSDYDIRLIAKKKFEGKNELRFWNKYNNRLLSGHIIPISSFLKEIEDHGPAFVWLRNRIAKSRLLYGDEKGFERIKDKVKKRKWTNNDRKEIIEDAYPEMIEYYGKMLNAISTNDEINFYYGANVFGRRISSLIVAINRMELDSENTMNSYPMSAKIKPKNYKNYFILLSGYSDNKKDKKEILGAVKAIIKWSKSYILRMYKNGEIRFSSGLLEVLKIEW